MANQALANSTINKYLRKVESAIFRKRKFLNSLIKGGRVQKNHSGLLLDWKVKYKRAPMISDGLYSSITFTADRNRHKVAQLGWRHNYVEEAITKGTKLQNGKGDTAIVSLWASKAQELLDDLTDQFATAVITNNGNTTTNGVHGLETLFGSITSPNSNGYIGTPAGTYAGITCGLGDYGGTWTGNWPDGDGDSHYDFWSPLVVDYTDTLWAGSTDTWKANAIECVHYAIQKMARNGDMLDIILLDQSLFLDIQNIIDAKERVMVNRDTMEKKGLGSTAFQIDGVDFDWEPGVGSTTGYGYTLDNLELLSLQGQLFEATTSEDHGSHTTRMSMEFWGNLRIKQARNMLKFDNLT